MQISRSCSLSDIIAVNKRSVDAKTDIRIFELSTLNNLIPAHEAEAMRMDWRDRGAQVRQLTNCDTFEPWTDVPGFIESCMHVRYVSDSVLPISTEVLLFDDVVAFYRVLPNISCLIVEDAEFAKQQQKLFDLVWDKARPVNLKPDGSLQ